MFFLTSFLIWFFCSLYLISTGFFQNFDFVDEKVFNNGSQKGDELSLETFWSSFDIIKNNYYSYSSLKTEDIENGLIRGLVESLDDKHSEFMDRKQKEQFNETLAWDFEGIGATVLKHELWVFVDSLISGSPAKKYGVRSKDIIVKANGEELKDLDLYDAVSKIRWKAGTEVVLTILREGENDILEIKVIREKIVIPSVELKIVEGEKIAHLMINMFGQDTSTDFRKYLKEIEASDVDGVIIDLRDNGGWFLSSAVEILSEFIPTGEILVETKYRDAGENTVYLSANSGKIFDKKVVVLVNGNSASASEITAWALREYDKAIIVWEKTYGKWSVQEPFDLWNGGLLKLTIAHWYTPKWRSIEKDGIEPDVEVQFEDADYEAKFDRQFEEAKKVLKEFIKTEVISLTIENYKKALESEKVEEKK